MTIANKIASQVMGRDFDTDSLVMSQDPVYIAYGKDSFSDNTAEFTDGSWITWNYKNEIELGEF